MTVATIAPTRTVRGRVRVPGDKSISHRYALVAALAEGDSTLTGYSAGADCHSTLACLARLGVPVAVDASGTATVSGLGLDGFRAPAEPLDAGNSGTTMRMLAGVLAGRAFTALIGDASLSKPMRA
jgi:3-phosphoshikimate 1-carboxyvinyltransferase